MAKKAETLMWIDEADSNGLVRWAELFASALTSPVILELRRLNALIAEETLFRYGVRDSFIEMRFNYLFGECSDHSRVSTYGAVAAHEDRCSSFATSPAGRLTLSRPHAKWWFQNG